MRFENILEFLNKIPWSDIGKFIVELSPWVTIAFLLKDRTDKRRPHMEITVELLRSSLACLVLRNTGDVPLSLKDIEFDDNFISQLPINRRNELSVKKINDMVIAPGQFWVVCLDTTIPNIIQTYSNTVIHIEYAYSGLYKKKCYCEKTYIDFKQYSDCMVYISDIYELVEENKRVVRQLRSLHADMDRFKNEFIEYSDLSSNFIKRCSAVMFGVTDLGSNDKPRIE